MFRLAQTLNFKTKLFPIWFMRQAGRYLPEFREVKLRKRTFLDLCLDPKYSTEITLQPIRRFDLDAAIIFSDILIVPNSLGQRVYYVENVGPILEPLQKKNLIKANEYSKFLSKVSQVYKQIRNVKKKIKRKALIGFAGAPWTLAVYMLKRTSPKYNFKIKNVNSTIQLVNFLTNFVILHIEKQIENGADVIQIFDSWAGLIKENQLHKFCFSPTKQILKAVKRKFPNVPIICFPRGIGKKYKDFVNFVKPDCISIDQFVNPSWAISNFNGTPIQGGINPNVLCKEKKDVKKITYKYLSIFKEYPYIFNLGHGITPGAKIENIKLMVEIVKKNRL